MLHTTISRNDSRDAYEADLVESYGSRPENPFTTLRKRMEWSHETLARNMFASRQALIRLEQGCFESPLPVAVEYWVKNADRFGLGFVTEGRLTGDYEEFQSLIRQRHHKFFGQSLEVHTVANAPHPLRQLPLLCYGGMGASVTEVAKALCVNQSTLQHWEKKWRTQQSVPRAFLEVLVAIGYSTDEVRTFQGAYTEWRLANK